MSRTFRNRHSAPHGWRMLDGNRLSTTISELEYLDDRRGARFDYELFRQTLNRRPKFRRSFWRCERKRQRRAHYDCYRRWIKHLLFIGEFESIVKYTRTGGWLTW